ncbi:hypothetical protein B0A55_03614 [Friedmanniomyces simplex]|uniref:DUF7732 domain-containing protein n=1 Tax=Friedmanniomyces simplex TaxID=329884 RepID=A0A4U0XPI2_9PEZI|nr:hypothetical protein B0A55_03614 [Friedmanniomyces simplex]
MKLPQTLLFLLGIITTIHALALPSSLDTIADASKELFKRKGGGGGHGSSGGGSSGGSSGGKGGSTSSSGSSGSRSGASASTSNTGGRTSAGSGVTPSFGGGRYYGGGAAAPYTAGSRSPGGVAPYLLAGGALAFFPGIWLYGAYAYPYYGAHTYHNNTDNQNETRPIQCYCAQYAECGCDNNTDSSYLNSVANNNTVSRVADVNGTETLLINGTLENGTTASGGTSSAAGSFRQGLAEKSGWWVVVAGVGYTMWLM